MRPLLLRLYERYYLELGDDLRPAVKAITIALLPGMEEETGDFFDPVLTLLTRISDAVTTSFFNANVFLILVTSPSARLSALNYLSRRMLKPPDPTDVKDAGLLIRGVAAVLEDENVLVRRTGLDLLLRVLPLNGALLQDAAADDHRLLLLSAASVILQRELSLTRRVHTWLLGPAEGSDDQLSYFKQYALQLVVDSLRPGMENPKLVESSDAQRPYKIFVTLLDKWEIGAPLSDRLALPALDALRAAIERTSDLAIKEDLLTTATGLYEAVEPLMVWRSLWQDFSSADVVKQEGGARMAEWLLRNVRMNDEDTVAVQLPVTLQGLLRYGSHASGRSLASELAVSIISRIPSRLWAISAEQAARQELVATELYGARGPSKDFALSDIQAVVLPDIAHVVYERLALSTASTPQAERDFLANLRMAIILMEAQSAALPSLDSTKWTSALLRAATRSAKYDIVDSITKLLRDAHRSSLVKPSFSMTSRGGTDILLSALFRFLAPKYSPHHLGAVDQIWTLNEYAEPHGLENAVARRMSDKATALDGLESFGTLWRHTDDAVLPGEIFFTPLLLVLQFWDGPDPFRRQAAETWLRTNLRSYFRALDPMLARLLDPTISQTDPSIARQLDLAQLKHCVDCMSILFRSSGQTLHRACQSAALGQSPHPSIATYLLKSSRHDTVTYAELILDLMIPILGRKGQASKDTQLETGLHAAVITFLQSFVSQGELAPPSLHRLEGAVMVRLNEATADGHITLQPALLRLLLDLLAQSHRPTGKAHRRSTSLSEKSRMSITSGTASTQNSETALLQVVLTGLTSPQNRPIMQHWVDFVVSLAPLVRDKPELLASLCEAFAAQLRAIMLDLHQIYAADEGNPILNGLSDAEPLMLLAGIERLITAILPPPQARKVDEAKSPSEGSSIFGLMSNVFTVEAPDAPQSASELDRPLEDAVTALLVVWSVIDTDPLDPNTPLQTSQDQVYGRIRTSSHKILERLYKAVPTRILGTCVAIWGDRPADVDEAAIFACIDALAPSAQRVVETTVQAVQARPPPGSEAFGRNNQLGTLAFVEAYIRRLEAPIAVQVWQPMFAYGKDLLQVSSTPAGRTQLFPAFRCLTALVQIVASTSALEDRRLRRDVQETYIKLLDLVASSARSVDGAAHRNASIPNTPVIGGEGDSTDSADDIPLFVSGEVVPHLRTLLGDTDRVVAACTSVFAHLVTPPARQFRFDSSTLHLASAIGKAAPSSKAWRVQIGEVFNDARFFKSASPEAQAWKAIVGIWFDGDKERFTELLGRITAASSANIFASREQEMITRCLNLRRLSLVIYAGEIDHYLTHLPSVQERLVDILRSASVTPKVHAEVYLCLRVIMCRISAQHLTNFWPVILSELLRLFEDIMDEPPEDGSESLPLILAACKFLDLLLVIQTEDFQIHQWIFVTDTTDAVFPPEDYLPEAIMDRLSELLSDHLHISSDTQHQTYRSLDIPDSPASSALRRPRLSQVQALTSLRQLHPFFARSSIDTYEGVYSNQGIDWEAVENNMDAEIFDRD